MTKLVIVQWKTESVKGIFKMDLVSVITAGSVDDGKSTLIGRLLYETNSIEDDVLKVIKEQSNLSKGEINFAYFTDGLKAERKLGITIDVAYRYFKTAQRKFILVDAPGHAEYTRNMITGASKCDAIIILIDAINGVVEQTKRHSYVAKMLNISNVIVAINKMDLIENTKERYEEIQSDYLSLIQLNSNQKLQFVPISALKGYNIVENSSVLPWYKEKTLLDCINTITIQKDSKTDVKVVVQNVISQKGKKIYVANLLQGELNRKEVLLTNTQEEVVITSLYNQSKEVSNLKAPMIFSFTMQNSKVVVNRGDVLSNSFLGYQTESLIIQAHVFWMQEHQITVGKELLLQVQSQIIRCTIASIQSVLNIHTLQDVPKNTISFNDIATVTIELTKPLVVSSFTKNKSFGSGILIDVDTSFTVGAVFITC